MQYYSEKSQTKNGYVGFSVKNEVVNETQLVIKHFRYVPSRYDA